MATVHLYDNVAQFSVSIIQSILITITWNTNVSSSSYVPGKKNLYTTNCDARSYGSAFLSPKYETKRRALPASLSQGDENWI